MLRSAVMIRISSVSRVCSTSLALAFTSMSLEWELCASISRFLFYISKKFFEFSSLSLYLSLDASSPPSSRWTCPFGRQTPSSYLATQWFAHLSCSLAWCWSSPWPLVAWVFLTHGRHSPSSSHGHHELFPFGAVFDLTSTMNQGEWLPPFWALKVSNA